MSGTTELPLFGLDERPEDSQPKNRFRDIPPFISGSGSYKPLSYDMQCSGVVPQPVFVAYPDTQVELPADGRCYRMGDPYRFGDTVVGTVLSVPDERGLVRIQLTNPYDVTNRKVVSGYSREFL